MTVNVNVVSDFLDDRLSYEDLVPLAEQFPPIALVSADARVRVNQQ